MIKQLTIRNVRPEEGTLLAEIEGICFPPAEAASEEAIQKRLAAFPENFLAAETEGKVVGFINGASTDKPYLPDEMYHDETLHIPGGAYLTVFGLNVLPEFRRQGIAARLVERYVALARERGCAGVVLTCKDHLIPFYERAGFVRFGMADSTHGGQRWNDMRLLLKNE